MPRSKRPDEAGCIYHSLNRGNNRQAIFHKDADFDAFLRTLGEGLERYPIELLAFCLLPNHWHIVLRPKVDAAMGRFLGWVTATHTLRYHAHNGSSGTGHIYQGPFRSFPVQDDNHFLAVCRYVERNALSAGLTDRAERWRYGSLYRSLGNRDRTPTLLTPWINGRPKDWVEHVNDPMTARELERIRTSVARGRPFGDESWTDRQCERQGLWATMRPRGRPRGRKVQRAAQPEPK